MLEIAQNFEQIAVQLRPIVLIGPGLVAVLAGLFVWLGGLGARRVLAAIVGAVSGGICGFFITGWNIGLAAAIAAIAAIIAAAFEKIFITILVAALAAVFALAVFVRPYIEIKNAADFSTGIKQACIQIPAYNWVIIVALVVFFIAAGFLLFRLTSALCCATLGTMLIFAGMILLLLYKGAAPVSGIYNRSSFYAAVFVVMTGFGTVGQLLLCQCPHKQPIRKKEENKDKKKQQQTKQNWRLT